MKEMMKQNIPNYLTALGQVVPGKSIDLPNASNGGVLGIRLRGIPEAKCEMPDDCLNSDFESERFVLKYLAVESKVARLKRIDLHDDNSKTPRTNILFGGGG